MAAKLISIKLQESMIFYDQDPPSDGLMIEIDLSDVEFQPLSDLQFRVIVGIDFGISYADETIISLEAMFRLIYDGSIPEGNDDKILFLQKYAVPDTWPFWLSWLHGQLAFMGFAPTQLPPKVPRRLLNTVKEALEKQTSSPKEHPHQ